jgi:hypothetical protein
MNMQIFNRIIWQIPVLIFLVAMLTPSVSWNSSTFGLWPIWLLSMPLFAFYRITTLNRKLLQHEIPIKSAQVLVFNQNKRVIRKVSQKSRQAA